VKFGEEYPNRYDLSSLRMIVSGAAPLSPELALAVMDQFGEILYNGYASTEVGPGTLATPADLRKAPGTVGKAAPGVKIRILDEEGYCADAVISQAHADGRGAFLSRPKPAPCGSLTSAKRPPGKSCGATISVPGRQTSTSSDEHGRFTLTGLTAGPTAIRVRALGHRAAERLVTVVENGWVDVVFRLETAPVALRSVRTEAADRERLRFRTEVGASSVAISTTGVPDGCAKMPRNGATSGSVTP